MPAKKSAPADKPAKPASAVKKSAPAKKSVPASVEKPVKPAAKPAAKKPAPAKKPAAASAVPQAGESPAVEKTLETAVPPAAPVQPEPPAAPAPAPAVSTAPAAPVTPVVPVVPVAPVAPVAPAAPALRPAQPVPQRLPAWPEARPGVVQAIAIMTLLNGVLNILWGVTASCGLTAGLVTVCLVPFALLLVALGICEISYASRLMSNYPQKIQPSQTIAILEICCILFGNVISLVVGILALVFYSDPNVKAYFARLNAQA